MSTSSSQRVLSSIVVPMLCALLSAAPHLAWSQATQVQVQGGSVSVRVPGVGIDVRGEPGEEDNEAPGRTGSVAAAQGRKIVVDGVSKSLTVTCRDGAIEIGGTGNTVHLRGNCTSIIVEGTGNTVTTNAALGNGTTVHVSGTSNLLKLQGNCASVAVEGTGNSIVGMRVGVVQLSGTSNSVGWRDDGKGQPPEVSSEGVGNRVYPLR